jgi:hypothetical protein
MITYQGTLASDLMKRVCGERMKASGIKDSSAGNDVDSFIRKAKDMLERQVGNAHLGGAVRGQIEDLMSLCTSEEDAICLLIFRDSYLARWEKRSAKGTEAA